MVKARGMYSIVDMTGMVFCYGCSIVNSCTVNLTRARKTKFYFLSTTVPFWTSGLRKPDITVPEMIINEFQKQTVNKQTPNHLTLTLSREAVSLHPEVNKP